MAATPPEEKAPFLERVGVRYLERAARAAPPVAASDAIHVLNADERRALRRIERGAVLRAAAAGGLSAFSSALADALAQPLLGADPDVATHEQLLAFWAVVGGVTVVAAICEIGFLYWDALRTVHRLAHAAGLELVGGLEHDDARAVATALARAALELPNPPRRLFGVDPRRESSRLTIVLAALLYKAKVGLTNFLLKALIRRMLSRAAVRVYLAFVAVPVTALWNGLVSWRVVREARIRVMGPSAAREMIDGIFAGAAPLSDAGRLGVLRAVASSIVRTEDLHPNLVALLREVRARVGEHEGAVVDDTRLFLGELGALEPDEQRLVLRVLSVAAIIDGRLTRKERALVRDALTACGRMPDDAPVRALARAFVSGDDIGVERIRALA